MGENVSDEKARVVDRIEDTKLNCLPDEVVLALADIAEVAREGLLALSVTAGLAVLAEMMEAERTVLCGRRDAEDPDRAHIRGGTTPTSVVLGGRKVPIRRPRVATTDGSAEPQVESFMEASSQDLLTAVAMERMLVGVSARKYRRANEPMGHTVAESASGESASSVSRRFISGTKKALAQLLGRDLSGLEVAVLMVDGVVFAAQTCVVAMVITTDGTKVPVGLRHGDTENKTLVTAMLADLVVRGLDYSDGLLVVIDGAKALAVAVKATFGDLALIARCQLHKQRNVEGHLPKTERSRVRRRLGEAFNHPAPTKLGLNPKLCDRVVAGWPPSWTRPGPTRPARSVRASPRCSPCGVSGSPARCYAR